mgnify:CR=1 FL=1
MRKFALGFLLALSVSSNATIDSPDMVTMTIDEAAGLLARINQMESDQQTSRVIFARMQNRINQLEAEVAGAKCL